MDDSESSANMIENERQYNITKTQAERFEWALEQLQRDKQAGEGTLLAEVCEDAIRSQLGDLRGELREYEALKAREAELVALADSPDADIPETIADEDLPKVRVLTEEESREMRENLAQKDFGMSLDEFRKAWLAGEFDGDRERLGRVIALAMMLPEYWEGWQPEA